MSPSRRKAPSDSESTDEFGPAADLEAIEGWMFLRPKSVPERWRQRSIEVCLVPLLPEELASVVDSSPLPPELEPFDERLLGLIASGIDNEGIARRLRVSSRNVQRRMARLRRRFGVGSKEELALLLARRGFEERDALADNQLSQEGEASR